MEAITALSVLPWWQPRETLESAVGILLTPDLVPVIVVVSDYVMLTPWIECGSNFHDVWSESVMVMQASLLSCCTSSKGAWSRKLHILRTVTTTIFSSSFSLILFL
jgi:hypothetical protein